MTAPEKDPQPFVELLVRHDKGRLAAELTAEMHRAVTAAVDLGKPATLTLVVQVKPIKDSATLGLSTRVTTKLPTAQRVTVWFADGDGDLHDRDPGQLTIEQEFSRAAEGGAA